MEQLMQFLHTLKPGAEFTEDTDLMGSKILDSLSIVMLINAIGDQFDVEITPLEVTPDNFHSAGTIFAMIERLQAE